MQKPFISIALAVLAISAIAGLATTQAEQDQNPKPPTQEQRTKKPINNRRLHQLNDLEIVKVKIADKTFKVWVMDTEAKVMEGMMFLRAEDVNDDEGMIFVFKNEDFRSFWMQNTLIPLDIVFVAADGKIVNYQNGKPLDETSLPSTGKAKYVIEFKAGTMKKNNFRAGQKFESPKDLKGAY